MPSSSWIKRLAPAAGCLAVALVSTAVARVEPQEPDGVTDRMARAARSMLAALPAKLSGEARTLHEDPERTQWAFGPVQREGLAIGALNEGQVEALEALLDTALSDKGMAMWRQVRQLETELRRLESTPEKIATHRDPDLYWLRVYGEPDPEQRWSWRFEGHHLALHVDCRPGRTPSVTPFFVGARPVLQGSLPDGISPAAPTPEGDRPAGSESGVPAATVDVFGALNRGYRSALKSGGSALPESERPRPRDIQMGPGHDALPAEDGVRFADLQPEARASVAALLTTYLELLEEPLRVPYAFDPQRANAVRFMRWGAGALDGPRAWTLLTPRFALELFTTEGPDHVHAVLRDIDRDFGGK